MLARLDSGAVPRLPLVLVRLARDHQQHRMWTLAAVRPVHQGRSGRAGMKIKSGGVQERFGLRLGLYWAMPDWLYPVHELKVLALHKLVQGGPFDDRSSFKPGNYQLLRQEASHVQEVKIPPGGLMGSFSSRFAMRRRLSASS